MRVLITGSKGYIGKHLIKMIEDNHPDLTVSEFYGDITDEYAFESTDTIIHLAALVRVGESEVHPYRYYKNNVFGTNNILNRFVFDNFIFASSGTASAPSNPYSLTKRMCEHMVENVCKQKDACFTTFRFFNVIGSSGFPPTNPDGLLYNLIQAANKGTFYLNGTDFDTRDGTCLRDYVHVDDICRSLIKAVYNPSNNIENLGSGKVYTVKEIINTFKEVNKVDFEVVENPRRPGDPGSMLLDGEISLFYESNYNLQDLLKVDKWQI